jgi:hypothetical protein
MLMEAAKYGGTSQQKKLLADTAVSWATTFLLKNKTKFYALFKSPYICLGGPK